MKRGSASEEKNVLRGEIISNSRYSNIRPYLILVVLILAFLIKKLHLLMSKADCRWRSANERMEMFLKA